MAEIVKAIRDLAVEEKEMCVQCGGAYQKSLNSDGQCLFHPRGYDSWNRRFPCCGTSAPCQKSPHRNKHHCEYPYAAFFERSQKILGYTDTVDEWIGIEEKDLSADKKDQKVAVGQLLRWASRAQRLDQPLLLVRVGTVWPGNPYWFQTYTEQELDEIGKSGASLIFRTSESTSAYAMAEWIVDGGLVTGVRATAKVQSSEVPTVQVIHFTAFPLTKGELEEVSKGGLVEFKAASAYPVPDGFRKGGVLSSAVPREPREFKTQSAGTIRIKPSSQFKGGIQMNDRARRDADIVGLQFAAINTNKTEPVTVMEGKAFWRFVGNPEWKPVDEFHCLYGSLPQALPALTPVDMAINVVIKDAEDDQRDSNWFNRSWVARHQPIRVKLVLEDMDGNETSHVFEYVHRPYKQDEAKADDEKEIAFVFVDDLNGFSRAAVRVTKNYDDSTPIVVGSHYLKDEELRAAVFKAREDGNLTPILFEEERDWYSVRCHGFVDLSVNRVYMVKIIMWTKDNHSQHVQFVLVPEYGECKIERPPQPTPDNTTLPEWVEGPSYERTQDDDLDDKPAVSAPAAAPAPGGAVGFAAIDPKLEETLVSLNHNMTRMADTFEKILALLAAKYQ